MRQFMRGSDNSLVNPSLASGMRGQAAVETAIVMPLMTFMVLGIIQLTMMQQASLMTEYAAYQACRAGVVWNGNNDKMVDAAIVALAPTAPGGKLFPGSQPIHEGTQGLVDLAATVASMQLVNRATGLVNMSPIRIDVINPDTSTFSSYAGRSGLPKPNELVFDDVGYSSTDGKTDGFLSDEGYRKALQLTIRVRYLYEMKIPFAAWIIQTCFFAANAPRIVFNQVGGALGEESITHKSAVESGDADATAAAMAAAAAANGALTDGPKGKPILTAAEFLKLYGFRAAGIYLVPLTASYTLRMQSNFYKGNLTN